jgi:tRNA1Val (adenine37-N6)-methyltransferase
MANNFFQFKQFTVHQDRCAMKVTTDACLFGAWVAEEVKNQKSKVKRVLDIGTGTGLLSLMLAQKTNALIDTIEIDQDAFEQARENISASPWNDRINIYHADAREFSFPLKYDIIISNPPFYENELKSADEKKNMAHHGGLLMNDLLEIIFSNLETTGEFYLLLPSKRSTESSLLLSKYKLSPKGSMMIRQSTQHDYFRMFIKGQHSGYGEETYSKTEIAIVDEKKEYTKEFIELLKDYYLYL